MYHDGVFCLTVDEAISNAQDKRLKEALDLVWMHLTTENLQEEMNKRYRNADVPFFIKIERIQHDNH
jgi:hypothetical protein